MSKTSIKSIKIISKKIFIEKKVDVQYLYGTISNIN